MSRPALAVVGVGYMGGLHAAKLAELAAAGEVELVGVCDIDAARAAEVAEPLGAPVLPTLDDVAVKAAAACVAVPTGRHVEVAAALLRAGLDVLIEKPMATTREEARELIELARSRDRVLQVGHVERFSPALREVQPVIRRPRFIEVHRIGPYRGRATDVGVVLDLMIHDLDIVAQLADSEVDRVEAIGVPVLSRTDDIANARLRFANGCVVNLTASRVSAEPLRKVRVFQPDAYISIDFVTNRIQVLRRESEPGGATPRISGEEHRFDAGDALLAQDRAFAEAVRARSRPAVSGEDGYRALDVALRIQESMPPREELQ